MRTIFKQRLDVCDQQTIQPPPSMASSTSSNCSNPRPVTMQQTKDPLADSVSDNLRQALRQRIGETPREETMN